MKIYAGSKTRVISSSGMDKVQYFVDTLNAVTGHVSGEIGSYIAYRAYDGRRTILLGCIKNSDGEFKPMTGYMPANDLIEVIKACIEVFQNER